MKKLNLYDFELYQKSRVLSRIAWRIYIKLPGDIQYKTGGQFLESADSVQANIAEGFGRYHYKDKLNFHFYARGSLIESLSWSEVLLERELIGIEIQKEFAELANTISMMNNAYIRHLWDQSRSPRP